MTSKPQNARFISQTVKENGYCGEVSESGEWVCVKDADHTGPHGDERWGASESNQHKKPTVWRRWVAQTYFGWHTRRWPWQVPWQVVYIGRGRKRPPQHVIDYFRRLHGIDP